MIDTHFRCAILLLRLGGVGPDGRGIYKNKQSLRIFTCWIRWIQLQQVKNTSYLILKFLKNQTNCTNRYCMLYTQNVEFWWFGTDARIRIWVGPTDELNKIILRCGGLKIVKKLLSQYFCCLDTTPYGIIFPYLLEDSHAPNSKEWEDI